MTPLADQIQALERAYVDLEDWEQDQRVLILSAVRTLRWLEKNEQEIKAIFEHPAVKALRATGAAIVEVRDLKGPGA